MRSNNLELWSDLPITSPRRSRLFSMAPIGVGTDRQEALSSYMVRLARAHSVSPLDLCNRELLPITEIKMGKIQSNFVMKDAKTMNGLNKYARETVKGFQQLTHRDDIVNCTLLPWKGVIDNKAVGLLHANPRWCPACFIEWRAQSREPYWPLLWFLTHGTQCRHHRKVLEEYCPHCGKHQPFIPKHYHMDYCSHCGESLAFLSEEVNHRKEFAGKSVSRFNTEAVANMITENPRAHEFANHDRLVERLRDLTRILGNGNPAEMHRKLGLRPKATTAWCQYGEHPTIESLLVICYRLNISPVKFLAEPLSEYTKPREEFFSPPKLANRRMPSIYEAEQLRAALQSYLSKDVKPLPMIKVAELLGRRKTYLSYWFKTESLAISERYKEFRHQSSIERNRILRQRTEEIAREIFAVSPNATIKSVQARLQQERICLAWPETRAVVHRVRQEYRTLPPR